MNHLTCPHPPGIHYFISMLVNLYPPEALCRRMFAKTVVVSELREWPLHDSHSPLRGVFFADRWWNPSPSRYSFDVSFVVLPLLPGNRDSKVGICTNDEWRQAVGNCLKSAKSALIDSRYECEISRSQKWCLAAFHTMVNAWAEW